MLRKTLGLYFLLLSVGLPWAALAADPAENQQRHLSNAFVEVTALVPDALLDIRYYSAFNSVGSRIDGYDYPIALLARPAAEALALAASAARERGYVLRVFDAYRPQAAVDHFVRWAEDLSDQALKNVFYPDVDKSLLFAQGYIASKSGHSRGATVDLTLVERANGRELDMGSPFDFFGPISHHGAAGLTREQAANRELLKSIMEAAGFRPYAEEWWHYTLADEPYPNTYFNFPNRRLQRAMNPPGAKVNSQ
jgi:D-alanyl-D-alanine dipeptidase